jgi:hypothetical protein
MIELEDGEPVLGLIERLQQKRIDGGAVLEGRQLLESSSNSSRLWRREQGRRGRE